MDSGNISISVDHVQNVRSNPVPTGFFHIDKGGVSIDPGLTSDHNQT
jgi:hypothetical protein